MNEVYFHEDDYCLAELVPIENEQFVKKEVGEVFNFSEEHKAANGSYTDIYVGKTPPKKLEEYKIDYIEIDKILSNIAIRYEKVTTGYSTHTEECKNTIGYSYNEIKIFISYNDRYITHIWFDFYLDTISTAEDLYKILKVISSNYDLIFVHWAWCFYSRIRHNTELKNKLIEISKELSEAEYDV